MKPRLPVVLWAGYLAVLSSAGAADFTVTNTNNAGAGSLRQAITDANATPGRDRVVFAIPGTGLQVIRPATPFPVLTDPVEIDAYTQPGSSPNTMSERDNAVRRIELDGMVSGGDGFTIRTTDSVVRGFSVRAFASGVSIEGSSNRVVGNHLGTDTAPMLYAPPSYVVGGNFRGISIGGTTEICCNAIGSSQREDRNVIAGNNGNPITIGNGTPLVSLTRILGNFVGVDSSGVRPSVFQNNTTLSLYNIVDITIGGLEEGAGNVFASGPSLGSISFQQPYTTAVIRGNKIGIGADGITRLPNVNFGIFIRATGNDANPILHAETIIEGNTIAYCDQYAIGIAESEDVFTGLRRSSDRITISKNRMFANATNGPSSTSSLSIILGSPAITNDFLDFDTGANNRQNYPEITNVLFEAGAVVSGVLNSAPFSAYQIEFFGNSVIHSSGFGEGEVYLGSLDVTTDGNGTAAYEVHFPNALPAHRFISATATDAEGSTSMFSRTFAGRSPTAPLIHLHPKSATILPYTNLTLVADVTGAEPLVFQWKHDGVEIPGETNLMLSLSNIVWESRGSYSLTASNAFGAVETIPATLTVLPAPIILTQPTNVLVSVGTNFTFVVQAGGIQPIAYQWRRDGVALPGVTNSSLTLSNIDWPQRGGYSVVVSNAFGVAESAPATLTVRVRPVIVQQPISQLVASGSVVYLSVAVSNSATVPLTYMLRSNNFLAATVISTGYVAVFPIGPVRTNAGYNIHVTNIFNSAGILSARATLTVAPDTDGDGLPDAFEDAYGLNRLDMSDAALDADGDGVTNLNEYRAGTDPADAANQLRISILDAADQGNVIEFMARSNRVYRVQYRDDFSDGNWRKLVDVPARETNRVERWADPAPVTPRFYRLQTPPVATP